MRWLIRGLDSGSFFPADSVIRLCLSVSVSLRPPPSLSASRAETRAYAHCATVAFRWRRARRPLLSLCVSVYLPPPLCLWTPPQRPPQHLCLSVSLSLHLTLCLDLYSPVHGVSAASHARGSCSGRASGASLAVCPSVVVAAAARLSLSVPFLLSPCLSLCVCLSLSACLSLFLSLCLTLSHGRRGWG